MFREELFTITQRWKQPRCVLTYEWINKMWYIHTVEYYSAMKRNRILTHATTWMNLGNKLSRRYQIQKGSYCMIAFIENT